MTSPRFDIVVFGATGYTGKFLVREWIAKNYGVTEKLTFAIAGRSKQKLTAFLDQMAVENKTFDAKSIECLIVDVEDANSVKEMCKRARLVINCVGPYRFYGENVVKQCVETRTHHLDVSGEPEYLEKMQLKYNQLAIDREIFVVGSCGFDSVPADLGIVFTRNNFKYDLEQVESYLTIENRNKDVKAGFNYATWESAVHGAGSAKNLATIRRQLFGGMSKPLPKPVHKLKDRSGILGYFYDQLTKFYCMKFIGSDKSVVQRTNYLNLELLDKRPIQYQPYFTIPSLYYTLLVVLFGGVFMFLSKYNFGRKLLLKHYKFFSAGVVRKEEEQLVTEKHLTNMSFKMQFRGYGYPVKGSTAERPSKRIITEVNGPEPGYVSTARIALNSAIVLLNERDKIPAKGGVLTPGVAFGSTSLIERLVNEGLDFKVLFVDDDATTSKESVKL